MLLHEAMCLSGCVHCSASVAESKPLQHPLSPSWPLSHEAAVAICTAHGHHSVPYTTCLQHAMTSGTCCTSCTAPDAGLICPACADPFLALLPAAEHWVVDSVYAAWFLLLGAALLGLWSLVIYMSNVWTHFLYPAVKDS
jgi:hypothetical protein